ncbi:MAG TPA: vWA domain-containing protein [Polyangia bacterium]|jgi:hypothetical protein|nr:vWA domain-containing protein [Polyangia bacterium]
MSVSPKSLPVISKTLSKMLSKTPSRTVARFAIGLGLVAASCAQKGDTSVESTTAAVTAATSDATAGPGDVDILFMIDNSSSMTEMQQKLAAQIPAFMAALQSLPMGLPNVHIAVVSSDLGAPGDSTSSIGCTMAGDQGIFQNEGAVASGGAVGGMTGSGTGGNKGTPTGGTTGAGTGGMTGGAPDGAVGEPATSNCLAGSLNPGATFISNVDGVANYTGDASGLLSCMAALGDFGCGFEHQLASISRALGADGLPAPAQNAGFLRPGAELAIVLLSNEDDCSAPAGTSLYSLSVGGSNQQNLSNALGPISNYRCNQYGHLCVDPTAAGPSCFLEPPRRPPADAQGTSAALTLNLTDCESDDSYGMLTSIKTFVNGIKALKADPDNQIVVGAIVAPPTPYTVAWVPEQGGQNTQAGELWPQVEHSCGAAGSDDVNPASTSSPTDGSFGDPAVRITQYVQAFGANGVTGSVCDNSYANAFSAIVSKIGAHLPGGAGNVSGSGGTGGTASALPICANGIDQGADGGVTASGGASGNLCGSGGTGGAPSDGLHSGGGCDVGSSRPTVWSLGLLLLFVTLAWRRRRASTR